MRTCEKKNQQENDKKKHDDMKFWFSSNIDT